MVSADFIRHIGPPEKNPLLHKTEPQSGAANTDEAVSAFETFRRGVAKVGSNIKDEPEWLERLESKAEILRFHVRKVIKY